MTIVSVVQLFFDININMPDFDFLIHQQNDVIKLSLASSFL